MRVLLVSMIFFLLMDPQFTHVVPPTNVTLHCHNLENLLEWNYDHIQPGIKFKVDIGSDYDLKKCPKEVLVYQPPLQVNLSYLSNPNAIYFLTVKALQGQNESQSSPPDGIIFTYFFGSTQGQKCSLDLPAVHVTHLTDGHVEFHFDHPWLLYHQKLYGCESVKKKKKLPVFKYNVAIAGKKKQHHSFECWDNVCKEKLQIHGDQETHCLQINGELEKMQVKLKQEFCIPQMRKAPPLDPTIIWVVTGLIILIMMALVFYMIYRRKTRVSTALPRHLVPGCRDSVSKPFMASSPEMVSTVDPFSPSPISTLDLEENDFFPAADTTPECDMRMAIGVPTSCLNVDRPAYMSGNQLEESDPEETEQDSHSPYESRSRVVVELAPEERNEGYRG